MFSCEFCNIFKDTFFYRTPPVTASVVMINDFINNLNTSIKVCTALGQDQEC